LSLLLALVLLALAWRLLVTLPLVTLTLGIRRWLLTLISWIFARPAKLLKSARQVFKRLAGALPAIFQAVRALAQLIGKRLVSPFDLVRGVLKLVGKILTRLIRKLARLIGKLTQRLCCTCNIALVERFCGGACRTLIAQRVSNRAKHLRVRRAASRRDLIASARSALRPTRRWCEWLFGGTLGILG
jgi:hypothetical protein